MTDMKTEKKRLIIFDCFGVVFGEVAPVFFRKHFPPEEAAVLKDKYFIPADLGLVTFDELFDSISEEKILDIEHCRKHNLVNITEE